MSSNRSNGAGGNGHQPSRKIRVAIVGVGNCASSLVQGRYYYENASETDFVPGLMHVNLGGYHIRDIEFVAAFDIDKNKVGRDLSEAIYTKPNNTYVFQQVPKLGVTVERGMTHDGLGKYLSQIIEKAPGPTADVVGILKERKVDLVVSYLPVGSEEATKWYVEQALRAGVITDAIRCLKLGLDRGLKGTLVAPSSYFMKSPPIQIHDDIARQRVEAFIRGEDNETLVGTENLTKAQLKKLASAPPVAPSKRAAAASAK